MNATEAKARKRERVLKDIPELVELLRVQKARERDTIKTQGQLKMSPELTLKVGELEVKPWPQAHAQVASKLGIPERYYRRMEAEGEGELLASNVNRWLEKGHGDRRLLRMVQDEKDGGWNLRAFLSDRYRPISHLDVLTTAVQVVSGQGSPSQEKNWSLGARCFSWAMSPMKLDVEFVNPGISVDLDHLESGVQLQAQGEEPEGPEGHGWLKGGRGEGGSPLLFPTCRIRNSETGHGGLSVEAGLYEKICDNTAHLGFQLSQVHLGGVLDEADLWSSETLRKMNLVIFAKVQDILRSVFNPERLLESARRFKGLEAIEVQAVPTAERIVKLNGLTEDVRDEILAAYYSMTKARPNLFDIQRAVTGAAHAFREEAPELSSKLEDIGGALIEKGEGALALA